MLALWMENRALRLRYDLPAPDPPAGEARVRVRLAGVCSTDLELLAGYHPFTGVPGHEFVGEVERGPHELVGRRVVGEINAVCGTCIACLANRRTHCERRTVLGIVGRDGAFAEALILPAENLHAVPDGVPDEVAVFTEPLAAALEIQEQITLEPGVRVVVVGDGKLGQLIGRSLALTGCELTVVGRHEAKLGLLAACGIATARPGGIADGCFDVAVECTGNHEGFALARRALRPRGTLVMKSTYAGKLSVDASSLVVDEITLVGSRCGPFAPALKLLAERTIDPRPLIASRYPLRDALTAFEHAGKSGVLKVLLDVSSRVL